MLLDLSTISLIDLSVLLCNKTHERLFRLAIVLILSSFVFNDSGLLVKVGLLRRQLFNRRVGYRTSLRPK
jgi:hypothetical protein